MSADPWPFCPTRRASPRRAVPLAPPNAHLSRSCDAPHAAAPRARLKALARGSPRASRASPRASRASRAHSAWEHILRRLLARRSAFLMAVVTVAIDDADTM